MDWETFRLSFLNWATIAEGWPLLLDGLLVTLELIAVTLPLAMAGGALIAVFSTLNIRALRRALILYVDAMRSFPPLVLLFLVFYGLPFMGVRLREFPAAALTLVLNGSAYFGEIFRAGIESVPQGQIQAARSTGLTWGQAMRDVVLPQAVRNVLPPLTTNTLELIKLTSIASAVALPEFLHSAQMLRGMAYNPTPLVAVAVVFFVLLWPLVRLVSRLERQMIASHAGGRR